MWRRSAAPQANLILGRTGQPFWQEESYDHGVRTEVELEKIVRYIERNPVAAGLAAAVEDGPWSSARATGETRLRVASDRLSHTGVTTLEQRNVETPGTGLQPVGRNSAYCQRTCETGHYIIEWVKFLRNVEGLPVKYISLHNEGEDYVRWPEDGSTAADPVALKNLGLITSHGFINFSPGRWFGDWRSLGNDMLRIPWAAVQRPANWAGGDPNPGTAFRITEDGQYTVQPTATPFPASPPPTGWPAGPARGSRGAGG